MKKQVILCIISILILIGLIVEVCIIVQKSRIKKMLINAPVVVKVMVPSISSTTNKEITTVIIDPVEKIDNKIIPLTTKKNNAITKTTKLRTTMRTNTLKTSNKNTTTSTTKKVIVTSSINSTSMPDPEVVSVNYSEENETYYKYGVKITQSNKYMIIKYDNDEVRKRLMSSSSIYDKSKYNASTNDLKDEAKKVLSDNISIYNEIVNQTNYYRTFNNLSTLSYSEDLSLAATVRAIEMAYSGSIYDISHTRPDGSSCFTAITDLKIKAGRYLAENISAGYVSAIGAVNAWYDSEGHRTNMLNSDYHKIGTGMYELDGYKYWVQIFSS